MLNCLFPCCLAAACFHRSSNPFIVSKLSHALSMFDRDGLGHLRIYGRIIYLSASRDIHTVHAQVAIFTVYNYIYCNNKHQCFHSPCTGFLQLLFTLPSWAWWYCCLSVYSLHKLMAAITMLKILLTKWPTTLVLACSHRRQLCYLSGSSMPLQ